VVKISSSRRTGRTVYLRVSFWVAAVATAPVLGLTAHANGPARPLVVVFATRIDPSMVAEMVADKNKKKDDAKNDRDPKGGDEVNGSKDAKDDPSPPVMSDDNTLNWQRAYLAARAVRDVLRDNGVADASLYSPDAPTFTLAMRENKLTLADNESPSPAERVALGRAVGATFVIGVVALQPKEGDGADIEVYATEVASRKTWAFRAQSHQESGGGGLGSAGRRTIGTDGQPGPYPVSLLSAANTIVTRFLAGPMGDYTRTTPPLSLLPPKPAPQTTDSGEPPALVAPNVAAPPTAPRVSAFPVTVAPVAPVAPSTAPPPVSPPKTAPRSTPGQVTPPPPLAPPVVIAPPRQSEPQPTTTPAPDPAPRAPAVDVEAVRRQADALIASGDINAAISVLRRAINQAPRDTTLRTALVKAYLAAGRESDANAEARRALAIAAPDDRRGRLELTRLLAQALSKNGDTTAARVAYQETIEAEPSAIWARIALADLLMTEGQSAAAEAQLKAARKVAPDDRDVALALARLLANRGDYVGALAEITSGGGDDATERALAARALFDEGAKRVASLLTQNRAAWENGTLSREAFYKATTAQSERAAALLNLLKVVPPPPTGPNADVLGRAHKKRVFAAALLSQSVAAMVTFLETGKESDGSEARVLLGEFQKEMEGAGGATAQTAPGAAGGDAKNNGVIVVQ